MFQLRALMAVACLSAAARGGVISAPAPFALAAAPAPAKVLLAEPFDPNPQYSFSYGVSDPHTGDQKQQHETRSGDVVQGSYSLLEPDGSRRTVHYQADSHSGFNAVVHREPAVAKAIVAAPAPALSLSLGGYH